jgi:glycosyltransferase involved in cell wall biosynthesis
MRIDIIFPTLPPTLDGIGDHTARLAAALAAHEEVQVRILTAEPDARPIPGVTIERAFVTSPASGVRSLFDAVAASPPDLLLLEFNQFSYGRWGLNPFLPWTLRRIRRACPTTRVAWMAHEDFVPPTSWSYLVMRQWQRWQFKALGRLSDLIFFSIDPWVQQYASWFPNTPVFHLPVASNMPRVDAPQAAARAALGVSPSAFVAGVFGTMNPSRLLSHIRAAAQALHAACDDFLLLYVGPDGAALRRGIGAVPMIDLGILPAFQVSLSFRAMDLHLAPFIDGVSTRRGSFLVGMQHGVAGLSTFGPLTDDLLADSRGTGLFLTDLLNDEDASATSFAASAVAALGAPEQRRAVGQAGRALYDTHLSLDVSVRRLLKAAHTVVHAAAPNSSPVLIDS